MSPEQSSTKKIAMDRLRFLAEILLVFLILALLLFIPRFLLPLLLDETSSYYEPIYYLIRAIIMVFGIPFGLFIMNLILESQKKDIIVEEDLPPATRFLKLFSISKKNLKYQLLYGMLIYFLIFLPLDFITYLIPGILEFQAVYLTSGTSSNYLTQNYAVFLVSVLIIQVCVSFTEESLTRGLVTNFGSENVKKMSAVIISSFYFGLMHWIFILSDESQLFPMWFTFFYLAIAFYIGVSLSIFIVRKRWILPIIIAHTMNNIVSAHSVWNHLQGNTFIPIAMQLYIPLLVIAVILFIWQFSRIKEGLKNGLKDFKGYFEIGEEEESTSDLFVRIGMDLLIGLFVFIVALLFAVG